jgi:uncharacterized protein (TIGR02266 family)
MYRRRGMVVLIPVAMDTQPHSADFPDEPTLPEQRADRRLALHVEVDVSSAHNFYTGLTQDISRGGLFVATHQPFAVGEQVNLSFTLPAGAGPFVAEAEVRWVRDRGDDHFHPCGMGLAFHMLTPEARDSITRFMAVRDSVFYDHDD